MLDYDTGRAGPLKMLLAEFKQVSNYFLASLYRDICFSSLVAAICLCRDY